MVEPNPLVQKDNETVLNSRDDNEGSILSESGLSLLVAGLTWAAASALLLQFKPEFGLGNAIGTGSLPGIFAFIASEGIKSRR